MKPTLVVLAAGMGSYVEMLEDLIISACNESIRKAGEAMKKGMEQAKGGLSIPGLL